MNSYEFGRLAVACEQHRLTRTRAAALLAGDTTAKPAILPKAVSPARRSRGDTPSNIPRRQQQDIGTQWPGWPKMPRIESTSKKI